MLLYQLREFISMRLDKITKLRRTYICDFEFKKDLSSKYRNLITSNTLHEERYDNPYPLNDDRSLDLIKRIEDIEQIVNDVLAGNDTNHCLQFAVGLYYLNKNMLLLQDFLYYLLNN